MVREIGHERALIVSDQGMVSSGIVEKISSLLNDDGIEVDLFTDVVADPPETVVHSAVRTARLARSNMIIGLGGGSSLDVAKLVALLVPEHQRLIEAYGIGNAIGYGIILILVAFFRELLGSGNLWGMQVVPDFLYESWYVNNGLMLLSPMALITVGIIIWIQRSFNKKLIEKG